jgi:hypothetical protein
LKQKQKEIANKAKYFWIFQVAKQKTANKANQR